MTVKDTESAASREVSDLIEHIYALTLDASKLGAFLVAWRALIERNDIGLQALKPHFEQGAQLSARLSEARDSQSSNESPHVVLQMNKDGELHGLNDLARDFLDEQENLPIAQESRAELVTLVRELVQASTPKLEHFTTSSIDGETLVFLVSNVSKLPIRADSALVICTGVLWPSGMSEKIRAKFGLSKAEVAVVKLLVEGKNSREIADLRSRSWETVRTQIRKIFKRTNVDNQIDLVRLVLGSISSPIYANDLRVQESISQFELKQTPLGDLEYLDTGSHIKSKQRVPWLVFHGCLPEHMPSMKLFVDCEQQRRRVLLPLRNGFGASRIKTPEEPQDIYRELAGADKYKVISLGSGYDSAASFVQGNSASVDSWIALDPWWPPLSEESYLEAEFPWFKSYLAEPSSIGLVMNSLREVAREFEPVAALRKIGSIWMDSLDEQEVEEVARLFFYTHQQDAGLLADLEQLKQRTEDNLVQDIAPSKIYLSERFSQFESRFSEAIRAEFVLCKGLSHFYSDMLAD